MTLCESRVGGLETRSVDVRRCMEQVAKASWIVDGLAIRVDEPRTETTAKVARVEESQENCPEESV